MPKLTKEVKVFLAITGCIILGWYLAGAFIAGSFNIALWNGFGKTMIVLLALTKVCVAAHFCFGRNSRNFVEKFSSVCP